MKNRSALKIVIESLIGKKVRFIIEARHIDGDIYRRHESHRIGSSMENEWTKKGRTYKYRDEIMVDKIVKIEIKDRKWLYHTLEGFVLERKVDDDICLVDD